MSRYEITDTEGNIRGYVEKEYSSAEIGGSSSEETEGFAFLFLCFMSVVAATAFGVGTWLGLGAILYVLGSLFGPIDWHRIFAITKILGILVFCGWNLKFLQEMISSGELWGNLLNVLALLRLVLVVVLLVAFLAFVGWLISVKFAAG